MLDKMPTFFRDLQAIECLQTEMVELQRDGYLFTLKYIYYIRKTTLKWNEMKLAEFKKILF